MEMGREGGGEGEGGCAAVALWGMVMCCELKHRNT